LYYILIIIDPTIKRILSDFVANDIIGCLSQTDKYATVSEDIKMQFQIYDKTGCFVWRKLILLRGKEKWHL